MLLSDCLIEVDDMVMLFGMDSGELAHNVLTVVLEFFTAFWIEEEDGCPVESPGDYPMSMGSDDLSLVRTSATIFERDLEVPNGLCVLQISDQQEPSCKDFVKFDIAG